jgi:hypothetical protein
METENTTDEPLTVILRALCLTMTGINVFLVKSLVLTHQL